MQGLDLPESNDPREVVQSIVFKQHMTVLGKEAMDVVSNLFGIFDFKFILQMCLNSKSKLYNCIKSHALQKKRESLEQWATMWSNINEQAEEEMKQPSQDVGDDSQVGTSSKPQLHDVAEFECVAVGGLLSGIADELNKAEKDVRGLLDVIQNVAQDKFEHTLHAKLIALSGIASCSPEKVIPGEWINIALGRVLATMQKSKLRSLNTVLKIILMKLVPYDMSFSKPTRVYGEASAVPQLDTKKSEAIAPIEIKPQSATEEVLDTQQGSGRQGKLDVGKYHVCSKVNKDGKRFWPCPYENCDKYFGSSCKCGAHLNEHLGRIYVCDKCKYETYSLDLTITSVSAGPRPRAAQRMSA